MWERNCQRRSGDFVILKTYVHAEHARDERPDADAHCQDGDFQVQRQEGIPVRVEDKLHDLLRRLDVGLIGYVSAN